MINPSDDWNSIEPFMFERFVYSLSDCYRVLLQMHPNKMIKYDIAGLLILFILRTAKKLKLFNFDKAGDKTLCFTIMKTAG
jgi:hypothetical protein